GVVRPRGDGGRQAPRVVTPGGDDLVSYVRSVRIVVKQRRPGPPAVAASPYRRRRTCENVVTWVTGRNRRRHRCRRRRCARVDPSGWPPACAEWRPAWVRPWAPWGYGGPRSPLPGSTSPVGSTVPAARGRSRPRTGARTPSSASRAPRRWRTRRP